MSFYRQTLCLFAVEQLKTKQLSTTQRPLWRDINQNQLDTNGDSSQRVPSIHTDHLKDTLAAMVTNNDFVIWANNMATNIECKSCKSCGLNSQFSSTNSFRITARIFVRHSIKKVVQRDHETSKPPSNRVLQALRKRKLKKQLKKVVQNVCS